MRQGLAFAPSGELFYASGDTSILRFFLDPVTPNGSFSIPAVVVQRYMEFDALGELFVPDHDTNNVWRCRFDPQGNPVLNGTIEVNAAIGTVVSASGELFVSSHAAGIYRFILDDSGQALPNGIISTPALSGITIRRFSSLDCDGNGTLDECELAANDCNTNGALDACENLADCNTNQIPDACESITDCNGNGTPDECENPAPCPRIIASSTWRAHGGGQGQKAIPISPAGRVELQNVTSESRIGGILELRLEFDSPLGAVGAQPITIYQQPGSGVACPPGSQTAYVPYDGPSAYAASTDGPTLVLKFSPPLENGRTYKFVPTAQVTASADQWVEVRCLRGDVNSDGRVNGTDRSVVVGVWTGSGFSPATDADLSGRTEGTDRSVVVGAWTGSENCAP